MSDEDDSAHTWCPKQERLLIRWAEKAAGYRWLHNHARLYYQKQNDYLSYPSIVIASLTGVGGFAVLNPSGEDGTMRTRIVAIQYVFAFLNVVGGILTSIGKFSQSASLSEAHSAMCVQYSKFYRNIDMELSLDAAHRVDVVEFVTRAREDYDRLLDDAPDIPGNSIHAFNKEFPNKENKPDVCNGLSIIVNDEGGTTKKTFAAWFTRIKRSTSGESELSQI